MTLYNNVGITFYSLNVHALLLPFKSLNISFRMTFKYFLCSEIVLIFPVHDHRQNHFIYRKTLA